MLKENKITKAVINVNKAILFIIMVAMVVDVFAQVLLRYFTTMSISWMDELARYLLILMAMFGMPLATYYSAQLDVKYFVNLAPPKVRFVLFIIIDLMSILFYAILVYLGYQLMKIGMRQTSVSLQIPVGYIYLSIPICSALTIYFQVAHLIQIIRTKGGEA